MMQCLTTKRLAIALSALVSLAAQVGLSAAASAKSPAYLVLMHKAVNGPPKDDARMRHFCLPDHKLLARLKKLGFEVGVAPYASGLTMDYLQQFNVIVMLHPLLVDQFPGLEAMGRAKQKLVLDYVKAGGGLLVMRATGWQFGKDIDELNRWLGPTGVEILSEQVVDEENSVTLDSNYKLSWTDNIAKHPVTEGVRGLFYTTYYHMYSDSMSPLRVSQDWTVLVRGKKTAKSLNTVKGQKQKTPGPGTYASEPPLLAVRDYGKGRIAVWPINATCVWQDGYHVLWGRGLTMEGKAGEMHGDAARLIENLMTYLAEPSRGTFGGYKPAPPASQKAEVGFRRINWDKARISGAYMAKRFKGLIGAKSSLSSGQAKPEEMIRAAQDAGYDFIGFADDLDKLTQQEFEQLAAVCKQESTDTFKAYPGFQYLDESGNSWVTFSDRLRWPEKGWWSTKHKGRIAINNPLSRGCQWPPVILINAHGNPEKPWFQGNFKVIALYTYDGGKLVDDSVDYYGELQRMRYQLAPVAVHLVRSPAEVKAAARNGAQTFVRWPDSDVVAALSGHIGRYKDRYVFVRSSSVSAGPVIEDTRILNFGTSDLAMPGNDRWRLHVRVTSPEGLREVEILNGDAGAPWRRFLPEGAKVFDTSIDHFHDQQYSLYVRATDANGKQAIGWTAWTSVQENSFPRCSDNINTMPRGKWWGQPKQMANVRGIENYLCVRNFSYMGMPTWAGVAESARPAVKYSPKLVCRFGTIVDCVMEEHYPRTASGNPDRTDCPELAVPNEFIAGKARHTLFTPWQDGPLVQLVDGDFTALQDMKLRRAQVCQFQGRQGADAFCGTPKGGPIMAGKFTRKRGSYAAWMPDGGFAALYPQAFRGSVGFVALQEGLRFFAFDGGRGYYNLRGWLGDDNRALKAGDKLQYRYLGIVSPLDPWPDIRFVTDVIETLGINGKTAYTVKPRIGAVLGTRYTLKLKAEGYGFAGRITQARLPLHLPTLVAGLNPRWHAGIWYKGRTALTVAEWVVNDMNQRFAVRKRRNVVNEIQSFPVMDDGTGFLQVDTSILDKEVFIGNLLVCDNPQVWLTLVDRRPGKAAFVAHNPADDPITCTVRPAPGFTLLGRFSRKVELPAGASVRVAIGKP